MQTATSSTWSSESGHVALSPSLMKMLVPDLHLFRGLTQLGPARHCSSARHLTWGQDGVKGVWAVHAHVGDGEGAAVKLVGCKLLAARSLHQVSPVAAELVDVRLVSVLQRAGVPSCKFGMSSAWPAGECLSC